MNRLQVLMAVALVGVMFGAGCDPEPELPVLGECPTDVEFFEVRVDPWMQSRCGACHSFDGSASDSGLLLDGELETRFASLEALASELVDDRPLLLLKPTDLHPAGHGGGQVLTPDSPEYLELVQFVGRIRDEIDDCGDGAASGVPGLEDCEDGAIPGPRVLRRLSHVEYGNTVRDLLGLTSRPELGFATDNDVHGFLNHSDALQIPPLLLEQYRDAAEELAEAAVVQRFEELMPCPESTAVCAADFVEQFGRRAFRRPLTEADRSRYMAIFTTVAGEDGFAQGIQWVITAMLQSPHFLYRSELGADDGESFVLTDWELATELSYLVLQTTPDMELLDAAAAGLDSATLTEELERLVGDPRSTGTLEKFTGQWLLLDRLPIVARDSEVYPEFTDSIRVDMAGEVQRLIAAGSDGTIDELLLAEEGFMTPELAAFYGVPAGTDPDAQGFSRTSLEGTGKSGLLATGALLTVHALPTGSSPIHRGVLVRERLLCQELPPPPANVDASPPPVDPELSTRERYEAHSAVPECAACHALIDPIGFAFEHYDGVGRWRDTDGPHTIDATGEIVSSSSSDGAFDGLAELSAHLATSDEVEECYSQQWLRFGTGLDEERGLACSAAPMVSYVLNAGGRLDSVFGAIAALPHFVRRLGEDGETDAPPVGSGQLPPLDDDTEYPGGEPGGGGSGTPGVTTDITLDDWGTGYCAYVEVTNGGSEAVTWEVVLTLDGTIDNFWNATMTDLGGSQYSFAGLEWNSSLAAGATLEFGVCGAR